MRAILVETLTLAGRRVSADESEQAGRRTKSGQVFHHLLRGALLLSARLALPLGDLLDLDGLVVAAVATAGALALLGARLQGSVVVIIVIVDDKVIHRVVRVVIRRDDLLDRNLRAV